MALFLSGILNENGARNKSGKLQENELSIIIHF
jgi:hypothetical protein